LYNYFYIQKAITSILLFVGFIVSDNTNELTAKSRINSMV